MNAEKPEAEKNMNARSAPQNTMQTKEGINVDLMRVKIN